MERKSKNQNDIANEWIKCQSKSRPGKLYYFNKTNGETRWDAPENYKDNTAADKPSTSNSRSPHKNNNETKNQEIAPKWTINKDVKNPAQDRLKRLQHKLIVEQKTKNKPIKKNSEVMKYQLRKENRIYETRKNQEKTCENESNNAEASTSKEAIATAKEISSTKEISGIREILKAKRKLSISSMKSTTSSTESTTYTPSKRHISTRRSSTELPKKVSKQITETTTSPRNRKSVKKKYTPHSSNLLATTTTTTAVTATATATLGSGIVNKIKDFFKTTINSYKNAKQATTDSAAIASPFDIILKTTTATTTNAATISNLDVKTTLKSCSSAGSTLSTTPKNLVIPTYEKGGANARLERLRLSLLQQPTSSTIFKATTSSLCASTSSSALACVIANNDSTNICEDVDEPMDWEPAEADKSKIELPSTTSSNSDSTNFFNRKQPKDSDNVSDKEQQSASSGDGTIGEYYNRVNENLLRFAAENQYDDKASANKWQTDYYYFVPDTNVMLRHSQFIGDVMRMHLCGTTGTIIYIPYRVLQELDKLKTYARTEGTKTLAIFAIKFLNAHFEAKNKHIEAQSAIEERNHIIDVGSPDDSIINCCLQVKQHVEHVILLTEDINLRNKAICNNILVSTKSDLTSRHPSNNQLLK